MYSHEFSPPPTPEPIEIRTVFTQGDLIEALNLLIQYKHGLGVGTYVSEVSYDCIDITINEGNGQLTHRALKEDS